MKKELKQELTEALLNNTLKEANYCTKWYGSYYTDLYICGHKQNGLYDIRKRDFSADYSLNGKIHFWKEDLTAQEVIDIIKRIKETTYYINFLETHDGE
jgi:hypothetical protein